MNRRGFMQFIGACAASSALPIEFADAKVAKAPAWAKDVIRFSCSGLEPGNYTFSAFIKGRGLFVAGITALGGETIFEIPASDDPAQNVMTNAHLSSSAITYTPQQSEPMEILFAQVERGPSASEIKRLRRA